MTVQKTDAKGRLSLGLPNTHFRVRELGNAQYFLEGIFDVVELLPMPIPESGMAYIRNLGLDPLQVLREDCNAGGYWSVELDAEGKRVFALGTMLKTRKPWPEGFDWDEFLEAARGGE